MAEKNNLSWRHHYVPEFHLKYWTDDTRQVFRYEKIAGKITSSKCSPRQIAFKKHLYAFEPDVPFVTRSSSMEDVFFKLIDDNASKVHKFLTRNHINQLSNIQKIEFSKYICSLIFRHPFYIERTIRQLKPIHEEILLDAKVQLENMGGSRLTSELELERQLNIDYTFSLLNQDNMLKNSVLNLVRDNVENASIVKAISELNWMTISYTDNAEDYFITSDNPLVVNIGKGLEKGVGVITLSVSPKKLLVISVLDGEDLHLNSILASTYNALVISQSCSIFSDREIHDTTCINNKKSLELLLSEKHSV